MTPIALRMMRGLSGLLVAALLLGVGEVRAHPHVWITATSEVLYAPDGSVTGVRHAWTFDDTFSAQAVQGLEAKTKGTYSREELAPLARTNLESMKAHAYYTFLKVNGKLAFEYPVDYFFDYKGEHLTLHFTLPLKAPVKSKSLSLEIVDRSFFVDFRMPEKDPVKLVDAPAGCRAFVRPPMGNVGDRKMVQAASEDSFKEGGANVTVGLLFDNKISVECP
ncbi:DUF1007 family protein [Bradyrhizobium quebecense]|uniref:DUF1007 family protein n=2 Tax=Bradyrhizobium quebecense TaxID=2748629 RepID=A0ACD3VGK9_9BRAD|nr:DUF1007 family protein [Bradyrhizobium quebecense]UGY05593.1 DUF1007 family protein [Bradyrhizobium quebecense]